MQLNLLLGFCSDPKYLSGKPENKKGSVTNNYHLSPNPYIFTEKVADLFIEALIAKNKSVTFSQTHI